jgi:hypothetical protein
MKSQKITQAKRGDYIKRKPDSKKTYIRGAYCKISKAYSCVDFDDISSEIFIKSNTIVFVDFTF